MRTVIILGTGGNCIDILDALLAIEAATPGTLVCAGFLDDDERTHGTTIHGCPVLGSLADTRRYPDTFFVNGIGSVRNFWRKREIIERADIPESRLYTVVHPSAQISRFATVGPGTVVLQNSVIASDASVGKHVMILPLSVISHDAQIGDYSTIAGGVSVSGNVRVGEGCYLGTGCAIRENVRVADHALCAMGSNVLSDVPEGTVVAGNPARRLRSVKTS